MEYDRGVAAESNFLGDSTIDTGSDPQRLGDDAIHVTAYRRRPIGGDVVDRVDQRFDFRAD
jgi:hypothetical protein